jgi:hypothetical protein
MRVAWDLGRVGSVSLSTKSAVASSMLVGSALLVLSRKTTTESLLLSRCVPSALLSCPVQPRAVHKSAGRGSGVEPTRHFSKSAPVRLGSKNSSAESRSTFVYQVIATPRGENTGSHRAAVIRGTIPPGAGVARQMFFRDGSVGETAEESALEHSGGSHNDVDEFLKIGQYAESARVFSSEEVDAFCNLLHDYNPLHELWMGTDCQSHASSVPDSIRHHPLLKWNDVDHPGLSKAASKPLVPGMLVSGLFSSIFGTLLPGTIYISQQLQFVSPVYVRDCVLARVQIVDIRTSGKGNRTREGSPPRDNSERKPRMHGDVVTCDTTVVQLVGGSPVTERSLALEREHGLMCIRGQAKVLVPTR